MGLLSNCVLVIVNVILSVVLRPERGHGEAVIISVFSWQNVKRERITESPIKKKIKAYKVLMSLCCSLNYCEEHVHNRALLINIITISFFDWCPSICQFDIMLNKK